MKDIFDFRSHM